MQKETSVAEIQVRYSFCVPPEDCLQVKSSEDVLKVLQEIWDEDVIGYQESFVMLILNRANRILGYRWVSHGSMSGTAVDPKHIFGVALKCNACALILAHNHPSGTTNPSQSDIALTKKLKKAGECLDIMIIDHLIITPNFAYYSFADEGVL